MPEERPIKQVQQWLPQHSHLYVCLRPGGTYEIIWDGDSTLTTQQAKRHTQVRGGTMLLEVDRWHMHTVLPSVVPPYT